MDISSCSNINSLAIPNIRWNTISIDFVMKIQKLLWFDIVMTIMDFISKRVYFILTHTIITAEKTAKLFLEYI